jgi:hypothetical protein
MLDAAASLGSRPGGPTGPASLQSPPSASLFAGRQTRRQATPATAFLGFGAASSGAPSGIPKSPAVPSTWGAAWWRAAGASSVGAGLWVSF